MYKCTAHRAIKEEVRNIMLWKENINFKLFTPILDKWCRSRHYQLFTAQIGKTFKTNLLHVSMSQCTSFLALAYGYHSLQIDIVTVAEQLECRMDGKRRTKSIWNLFVRVCSKLAHICANAFDTFGCVWMQLMICSDNNWVHWGL